MSLLTIYYTKDIEKLLSIKSTITHWLPENYDPIQREQTILYAPGNVIATTKITMLAGLQAAIKAGEVNPEQVIWIDCTKPIAIAHTIDENGNFKNFFAVGHV